MLWVLLLLLPGIALARARSTRSAMSADEAMLRDGLLMESVLPLGLLLASVCAVVVFFGAWRSGLPRRERVLLLTLAAAVVPMVLLVVQTSERIGFPGRDRGVVSYVLHGANLLWVGLVLVGGGRAVWPNATPPVENAEQTERPGATNQAPGILDALEMLRPLGRGRQGPALEYAGQDHYPPECMWRFREADPALEAAVVAAVEAFRGKVAWEMFRMGRNWMIAPTRLRAFQQAHDGMRWDVVRSELSRVDPEFGRQANADVGPLARSIRSVCRPQ